MEGWGPEQEGGSGLPSLWSRVTNITNNTIVVIVVDILGQEVMFEVQEERGS